MPSYQDVTICGHLGSDPEIRYTKAGDPVAQIRVAVSQSKRDESGKWVDGSPEWIRVVCFKAMANQAASLHKGSLVTILKGRLRTQKWQDKEGNDRYTTEVIAGILIPGHWSSQGTRRKALRASKGPWSSRAEGRRRRLMTIYRFDVALGESGPKVFMPRGRDSHGKLVE